MSYAHIDLFSSQKNFSNCEVCGDVIYHYRNPYYTLLILCDGLGHGIRANIAASMTGTRLLNLINDSFSLREAADKVAETMQKAKGNNSTYTAFTIVRILNTGETTILSYDMPGVILISQHHAVILEGPGIMLNESLVTEKNCFLGRDESLLIFSDGISQAGMGISNTNGWGLRGITDYVNTKLDSGIVLKDLPEDINQQSYSISGSKYSDDTTSIILSCRTGNIVNIFTGPPLLKEHDSEIVRKFTLMSGSKVVCGSTTADIVSRQLNQPIEMNTINYNSVAPPFYRIYGIDLVTEGAVTLNQVYHIIDADPELFEVNSGVTELCKLILQADKINFIAGKAANPAHKDIAFRQQGILTRETILPLLKDKLESMGKLVVMELV